MKTFKLLFILVITPLVSVFSQQELIGGQAIGGNRVNLLIDISPQTYNQSAEGSPYMNDEFMAATISASEDNVFYVRYNILADEFEVKGDNNKAYALNRYRRDIVIDILPLKKKYKVFGYYDKDNNENFGYFMFLSNTNSNHILVKKEKVIFIDEQVSFNGYDSSRPARFKKMDDKYYIKLDGNKILTELPNKKKAIAKLFPNHENAILEYMKSNRIKTSNEGDLIKLINYINSLS